MGVIYRVQAPAAQSRWSWRRSRRREYSRKRENGAPNYPYREPVAATSPSVRRAKFADWTRRTLRLARERGMTDPDITAATGIPAGTFHRWQSTKGGLPKPDKVEQFAAGLGVPLGPAYAAMGLAMPARTPEPELDPDLRAIGRRLADPNVSEDEKAAIRGMLRLLAGRAAAQPSERTGS